MRLVITAAESLGIRAFIVGAIARDIIFGHIYNVRIYRETADIDFGIGVESWAQYRQLKQVLIEINQFRADCKAEQRLWHGHGADEMKIDFIPYGNIESPVGQIAFPPDGDFVMNTNGFAEAYQHSLSARLSDDLTVRLASLAGLVVLKFIAYDDKPYERKKDLQDTWFVAKNYLEAGNEERLFGENAANADLTNDENFVYQTVGARLLGRDMAELLTSAQTRKIIFKHLSEDENERGLASAAETIKSSEQRFEDNFAEILEMLRQLKRGLMERLPN